MPFLPLSPDFQKAVSLLSTVVTQGIQRYLFLSCLWFSCLQALLSYYLNVTVKMKFNSFAGYNRKAGKWSVTGRKLKTNSSDIVHM